MRTETGKRYRLTDLLAALRNELWTVFALISTLESGRRLTAQDRARAAKARERIDALIEEVME